MCMISFFYLLHKQLKKVSKAQIFPPGARYFHVLGRYKRRGIYADPAFRRVPHQPDHPAYLLAH